MQQSMARVQTERASIHLQQLCKHFAHKLPVTFTPQQGRIEFSIGTCALEADQGVLTLRAEAEDAERLAKLQDVVDKHLARFAFKTPVTIEWNGVSEGRSQRTPISPGLLRTRRRERCAYRFPVNAGFRFARNAFTPSA
jgi:hypothetical protein